MLTNTLKINIRQMTEADLDQVLAIESSSFPAPWCREHFLHELKARYSFPYIAEVDETVVGYVCLMSLFEEAQILDIAVDPLLRGHGIARMLMEHAVSVVLENGGEVLSLEVRASNIAAIALYERCGFMCAGLRKKYYDGMEDAVLMEKRLSFSTLTVR